MTGSIRRLRWIGRAFASRRLALRSGTAQSSKLALEDGIPFATIEKLADMGHPVELTTGHARAIFGRGQIILRDPASGVLCGGSDPRADGCAMAL